MAKQKLRKIVSPAGTAAYTWLNKPDEGKKFSDGKYKTNVVFAKGEAGLDDIVTACKEVAKEEWGKVPKGLWLPVQDGDDHKNEEFHGKTYLVAKSKYKPGAVDAKRKELPSDVWPAAGDTIKVCCSLFPFQQSKEVEVEDADGNTTTKKRTSHGISLQLRSVQLLEKNNMAGNASGDFEDDDDYEGFDYDDDAKGEDKSDEDGDEDDGDF